jgi:hypothetical protein
MVKAQSLEDLYVASNDIRLSLFSISEKYSIRPITLAFPRYLETNHTDNFSICQTCEELDINIKKSLLLENIVMSDGKRSDFLILNPGEDALKLCDELRNRKKEWILDIMTALPDNLIVSLKEAMFNSNKKAIYQLNMSDIAAQWVRSGIVRSYDYAYRSLTNFSRRFDMELLSFKVMMSFLRNNEEVYIIHPIRDSEINVFCNISGIVFNENTRSEVTKKANSMNLNCFFGSGRDYI